MKQKEIKTINYCWVKKSGKNLKHKLELSKIKNSKKKRKKTIERRQVNTT